MAHFNFSQPPYLRADVGSEEGDLEHNPKREQPGASPGATTAPQLCQPQSRVPPRPGGDAAGSSLPCFHYPSFLALAFSKAAGAGHCRGVGVSLHRVPPPIAAAAERGPSQPLLEA